MSKLTTTNHIVHADGSEEEFELESLRAWELYLDVLDNAVHELWGKSFLAPALLRKQHDQAAAKLARHRADVARVVGEARSTGRLDAAVEWVYGGGRA